MGVLLGVVVVRTAAVRTRDNKDAGSVRYGVRHPRLVRIGMYVSRAYCVVAYDVMELPRWRRDGPLIRVVLGCG